MKTKWKTARKILIWTVLLSVLASLVACSEKNAAEDSMTMTAAPGEMYDSVGGGYNYSYSYSDADADYEYAEDEKPMSSASKSAESGTASVPSDSARKLIKNVNMEMETKEFDAFMASLETRIAAVGGYVQASSVRKSGSNRYASVTARIPSDDLDSFTSGVSEIANVVMKNENTEDVTLSYYDMESHIKALRSEYDTLLGILEKCTELTDVISVQSRITEVLYQIESYQSRLNNYDNLVAYSTVTMYISEVERETVVTEQTVGSRIADGFSRTVEDITDDLQDLAAAALFIRALCRRWNRRMAKSEAEKKD